MKAAKNAAGSRFAGSQDGCLHRGGRASQPASKAASLPPVDSGCELASPSRILYHCIKIMNTSRLVFFCLWLITINGLADGPADNIADKVRRIPPPGVA